MVHSFDFSDTSLLTDSTMQCSRIRWLPTLLGVAAMLIGSAAASFAAVAVEPEAPDAEPAPIEEMDQPGMLSEAELARLQNLISEAERAMARGWMVRPAGRSAADLYKQVLLLVPDHPGAREGLIDIHQHLLNEAILLARDFDFEAARAALEQAAIVHEDALILAQARSRVSEIRDSQLGAAEALIRELIQTGRFDEAEDRMTELVALGMKRQDLEALRSSLIDARLYGALHAGQTFTDPLTQVGGYGPVMVVIPAGTFMKGSPDSERGRDSHEGPRYRVVFERGFALAQTETTVESFAHFVEQTGYQSDAERRGWSRVYEPRSGRMTRRNRINWRHDYLGREASPDLPVIHVSWRDASEYAQWLAAQTGRSYRLPSEAEFEYALRAGSQSRYWWGDGSPTEPVENLTGDGDISPTNTRWSVAFPRYSDGFWGPAPAASLQANPFGLYDMGGNLMHWTEDCWHDSFVRAPTDGSAWVNPGCELRVIRGGSWSSTPDMSRSAWRVSGAEDSTDMRLGFRVARDL